mmetsp:Transcript_3974/g.8651  ORF Transcript_3974/g.8651 Transcript_3974/m.8651 type:complete len:96 (+) Transcript_3974:225-512(+)|eukprot:CAMPEP_0174731520 /NCGR_PEP_ID=MMETSP1094-20130205/57699_1 /TAXON_ID=156173 /ORGANISM="Chrysochromulina brevifilum, Strain UTEX LB 985" /LENGTH=95 /DNA_ID=CAMNT_0015933907 /DNA_START=219 /DNA_END=506 /DNA_ORIENTATION=-
MRRPNGTFFLVQSTALVPCLCDALATQRCGKLSRYVRRVLNEKRKAEREGDPHVGHGAVQYRVEQMQTRACQMAPRLHDVAVRYERWRLVPGPPG